MARLLITLTREEVQETIAYPLICETMCSAVWDTMKRRRRWAAEFTEAERKACSKLKAQAHKWHLSTGVPDELTISPDTLDLWQKLAAFCASL